MTFLWELGRFVVVRIPVGQARVMGVMAVGRRGTNECERTTKDNSMMIMVTSLVTVILFIENGETGVGAFIVLQIMS